MRFASNKVVVPNEYAHPNEQHGGASRRYRKQLKHSASPSSYRKKCRGLTARNSACGACCHATQKDLRNNAISNWGCCMNFLIDRETASELNPIIGIGTQETLATIQRISDALAELLAIEADLGKFSIKEFSPLCRVLSAAVAYERLAVSTSNKTIH